MTRMDQHPYQPPGPRPPDGSAPPSQAHRHDRSQAQSPASAPAPGHGHGRGHSDGASNGHGSGHGSGHGHGHSHSHGPAAPVSRHLRKVIAAILVPFTAAVVVGLVVLWPGGAPAHKHSGVGFDRQTQQATVIRVAEVSCASVNAGGGAPSGDASGGPSTDQQSGGTCKKATVRVDTGKDKGRTFTEIVQPDQPRQLHQGEQVIAAYEPTAPKDLQYSVADVNRKFPMALLAGIFNI